MIRALLRAPQRFRHVVRVAQKKFRRIHQRPLTLLRRHRKSPQCRFRKRIAHRPPLIRIVADRAKFQIRLHQQHLRPAALEPHQMRPAQLPAVQPDVIRTNPRRQRALVQELRPPLVDLQPQLARLRVPINIEVPRYLLHRRRLFCNRRRLVSRRGSLLRSRLALRLITRLRARSATQHRHHHQPHHPLGHFPCLQIRNFQNG